MHGANSGAGGPVCVTDPGTDRCRSGKKEKLEPLFVSLLSLREPNRRDIMHGLHQAIAVMPGIIRLPRHYRLIIRN